MRSCGRIRSLNGALLRNCFFPPTCCCAVAEAREIPTKRIEALVWFRTCSTVFSISLCFKLPPSSLKKGHCMTAGRGRLALFVATGLLETKCEDGEYNSPGASKGVQMDGFLLAICRVSFMLQLMQHMRTSHSKHGQKS